MKCGSGTWVRMMFSGESIRVVAVLRCPRMAGFEVSTEAQPCRAKGGPGKIETLRVGTRHARTEVADGAPSPTVVVSLANSDDPQRHFRASTSSQFTRLLVGSDPSETC